MTRPTKHPLLQSLHSRSFTACCKVTIGSSPKRKDRAGTREGCREAWGGARLTSSLPQTKFLARSPAPDTRFCNGLSLDARH